MMDYSLIENQINIAHQEKYAAIIGENPSDGARSPKLWNAVFKECNLNCIMVPLDVDNENIINLINNAVRATKANNCNKITLTSCERDGHWQFIIRDFGFGFSLEKLKQLGIKPVSSEQGLGMAVFLSHASLERLGGKLALTNHNRGGALVTLSLPMEKEIKK